MKYGEAELTLKAMLENAGVDIAAPEPYRTWEVFKRFALLPVEGVDPSGGDMLLFQWGVYDWFDGAGERFEIDFLRQFYVVSTSGAYDHIEQLHCTFVFEPSEELKSYGQGEQWLQGDLDGAFADIEARPVFDVLRQPPAAPRMTRIEQEQV